MNTHAAKLQERTLATAHRARTEWTLNELSELTELKNAGFELADIAAYLNRSYYAVATMHHLITSDAGAQVTERARHAVTKVRNRNQALAQAACSSCWMVHPGDCF